MTSLPTPVAAAFEHWRMAYITCYYAQPCPDEIMDRLMGEETEALRALADTPAETADDLVLKMLPLAMIENDPPLGQHPMVPVNDPQADTDYQEDALWRGIIRDLSTVSPLLANAMKASPSEYCVERAASHLLKEKAA